jgi:hypothetical protein
LAKVQNLGLFWSKPAKIQWPKHETAFSKALEISASQSRRLYFPARIFWAIAFQIKSYRLFWCFDGFGRIATCQNRRPNFGLSLKFWSGSWNSAFLDFFMWGLKPKDR